MGRDNFEDDLEPLIEHDTIKQKQWNLFKNEPRLEESGSMVESKYLNFGVKFLKVSTIILTFIVVLGCAVLSKGSLLFMVSQINLNTSRGYCSSYVNKYAQQQFKVTLPEEETTVWIWLIMFSYFVPELGIFIRSVRICCFKSWERPRPLEYIWLFLTESLPAIGSSLFIFWVIPKLDVLKAAMLTNALCFVPTLITFFSRNPSSSRRLLKLILDILAIIAQVTGFVLWPIVENVEALYIIPLSLIFISFGWWENFVSDKSPIGFIRTLAENKREFKNKTYFMHVIVAPLKCLLFFLTALLSIWYNQGQVGFIFRNFQDAFQSHKIYVEEVQPVVGSSGVDYGDFVSNGYGTVITTSVWTPLTVWIINVLTTYICYAFGKFACKITIQTIGFAFPVNLTVPVLLTSLIAICGNYLKDNCAYASIVTPHLFFNVPQLVFLDNFIGHQHAWIWLAWLMSQVWITFHIWKPSREKLASTEKLFFRPMYDALFIDQSLALNRRRLQDKTNTPFKHKIDDGADLSNVNNDTITKIYACGTMWHESKEEMIVFLKSILRMDEDQGAHKILRNYLQYNIPSYYEFETHIFFDDAYIRLSKDDQDPHINQYVLDLIDSVSVAASEVHGVNITINPPVVYPTPYGGRLIWTLPGKTKIVAHLKDKAKIRPKKRWSQVMYMYYLLGYRIMDNDKLTPDRIKNISENTYLLALDGDIDFQPQAVHLLVDYMKKNKSLGAACGRIHPIGAGAMAWYQIFEYAVGHWLQKATEHVIGCVLCSPGCFSLFRASALMDDNVMAKYTAVSEEARHYVQYDQGEDRWLCTLLLQRGYRVEYSAASDAYTHCPEGFNEFYNQRRRWMPSTTANILDLLTDYKHIVKVNDNISTLYILYQGILMVGTVIGPGTIFLMLIGSFVAAFKLSQWESFVWNAIPILIFVIVCGFCKSDTQLFIAAIISGVYGLIMMAVLIGILLQIKDDGWLAPSSLFFFIVALEFIITALLHPQEFYCLKYGVIYYVTVPSMYMILVIYSIFNMNDISWGTRDVTIVPQNSEKNKEPTQTVEKPPEKHVSKLRKFLRSFCADIRWKERELLKNITADIRKLQYKLDVIERNQYGIELPPEARKTVKKSTVVIEGAKASRTSLGQHIRKSIIDASDEYDEDDYSTLTASDNIQENSWFYDGQLIKSEVSYLDRKEEKFWEEVIKEYLAPLDQTSKKEQGKKDLKDLRDKMVLTFFMINSLFVLVVFLLTLQKDVIHLDWPISPKVMFEYNIDQNEFSIERTYLQLEPIGFVFLIFFSLLMVVQFFAMLIHRFGTFCQIMANTYLEWNIFESDNVQDLTEDQILEKDPLKIFKKLTRLQGINDDDEKDSKVHVSRRNTAHVLALKKGQQNKPVIDNLEKAFLTRMKKLNDTSDKELPVPRKTLNAINMRRETVFRRQSQLHLGGNSMIFTNHAFEESENL